jgi:hypothetical protein
MEKVESRGKLTPLTPASPPEPIFTSAHAALKFAFNFSHGTLKKNFLAAAMGGGGSGRGLGGLDGAAQAGMILCELEQLDAVRRRCITARMAPQTEPCSCKSPCCRGYREASEWAAAIEYLTQYVLTEGLTGTKSYHRLRRGVVLRHFGVKISLIDIAAACSVNRDTASDLNKRVVTRLRDEERIGLHEIDGRLKAAGIVGS